MSGATGDFDGRIAVVTGAASGIGEAVAADLLAGGATVVMLDLNEDGLAAAAARSPRPDAVDAIAGDVTSSSSMAAAAAAVAERHGRLDVLVNSAGIASATPFRETTDAEYERIMGVNAGGPWHVSRAFIGNLADGGGGALVNVSSISALRGGGLYANAAYAASKGAVISLTKALAREYAPGVRANVVCPGPTLTPLTLRQVEEKKGDIADLAAMAPLARAAEPAEIAAVISFLASDASSYVTGQIYTVDGGITT